MWEVRDTEGINVTGREGYYRQAVRKGTVYLRLADGQLWYFKLRL